MFELDIEQLKEQGMQLMDTAKKTAMDLADKGKSQLDLLNQQARLSKAQRQLGAVVYSLYKSGESNQPLVDKYLEAIDEVEGEIEQIRAKMSPEERAEAEAAEQADEAVDVTAADEANATEEEPVEEEEIRQRGETKQCPVCGAEVDADALFCNHCGAQL